MPEQRGLSYRDAGVNIDAGDALVARIKPIAARTCRPGCLGTIGGFGGLFQLPVDRYREPVLVSGADGVGTKLKLAQQLDRHATIGIDLVAMCANDVLVCGAEPLFFLDYFATGRLEADIAATVITGIGRGCEAAGAALIGGETAEMPGMYPAGEYDLAGFCVGVVEKDRIIDGTAVAPGDVVLGLASSGPHANGYSLIRRIIAPQTARLGEPFEDATLADRLLAPTRIYVKPVLELLAACRVKALAHITGGGLPGNLVRVLPDGHRAVLDATRWRWSAVFQWLQDSGAIAREEMYRTFNCGIGFVLVLDPGDVAAAAAQLAAAGETVYDIGRVEAGGAEASVVIE